MPSKEILSGADSALEIARDDSLRGMHENKPTPGFVFLQPNDGNCSSLRLVRPPSARGTGCRCG